MRNLLPKLLVLTAIALPIAARADTLDTFNISNGSITFTLPATPPVSGPSDPDIFETFPVLLSFDPSFCGNPTLDGQIVFYSALEGGGLEVVIFHPGGTTSLIDHGDLLYSGTTADPTFCLPEPSTSATTPSPSLLKRLPPLSLPVWFCLPREPSASSVSLANDGGQLLRQPMPSYNPHSHTPPKRSRSSQTIPKCSLTTFVQLFRLSSSGFNRGGFTIRMNRNQAIEHGFQSKISWILQVEDLVRCRFSPQRRP